MANEEKPVRKLTSIAITDILTTPDYAYIQEKRAAAVSVGFSAGLLTGLYKSVVPVSESLEQLVWKHKLRSFGTVSAWTAIGATAGLAYMMGVQAISEKKGKEDSPVNHFAMGFLLSAPFAVAKANPTAVIVRGTLVGSMCAFLKYAGTTDFFRYYYTTRIEDFQAHSRYPETYAAQEALFANLATRKKPTIEKYNQIVAATQN